jgi:hypothetical protein
MTMSLRTALVASAFTIAALTGASSASATTCIGACGALGPDGVVTAPPGGSSYGYVTTQGGVGGAGQISGVGGTNGSEFITDAFAATNGDVLEFQFNYVTSDGAGFSDYSFAELLTGTGAHVAWLFTARTTPSGDTSPGFGLPPNDSALTPATTPIIGGGVSWSPLDPNDSPCYDSGCGYTGWIKSDYTIATDGSYKLRFGVTNSIDTRWNSGLAYAGANVGGTPIDTGNGGVPEPATWAMMLMGMFGLGSMLRTRKLSAAAA